MKYTRTDVLISIGLTIFFSFSVWLANGTLAQGTIAVNTTSDENTANMDCSIREAIISANNDTDHNGCIRTGSAPYTINIPSGTYTLSIGGAGEDACLTGDFDLLVDMTIDGAGQTSTIIDADELDRIFHVEAGNNGNINVTIQDLSVNGGKPTAANSDGGGIDVFSGSSLTLTNVSLNGNSTGENGGGLMLRNGVNAIISNCILSNNNCGGSGGGLSAGNGSVDIINCLFSGNSATEDGGGVRITGTATISGSTFYNNLAVDNGGGIDLTSSVQPITIINSTITANSANRSGGGIVTAGNNITLDFLTITDNIADNDNNGDGDGGGIFNNGRTTTTLRNCIVQGNDDRSTSAADDCDNSTFNPGSDFNVVGTGTGCPTGTNGTTGNAMLGALADNGGPTQTHLPQSGSAAYNLIPNNTNGCGNGVTSDQRNFSRPQFNSCDAGAVESSSVLPVELLTFDAKPHGSGVLLSWKTAFEHDNRGFEIEWAPSITQNTQTGISWKPIAFVDGSGNTSFTQSYTYIHKAPLSGTNHYRLLQYDYNGAIKSSKIVSIALTDLSRHILVFPNPVQNQQFSLYFPPGLDPTKAKLYLYNNYGKLLMQQSSPRREMVVKTSSLLPGIYHLRIDVGQEVYWKRVIVKR